MKEERKNNCTIVKVADSYTDDVISLLEQAIERERERCKNLNITFF